MNDCCMNNLGNAKRVGRAHYVCPVCGQDVSIAVVLYQQAVEQDAKLELEESNE